MKKSVIWFWIVICSVLAPGLLAQAATETMDDPSQFIKEGGLPEAVDEEVEEWLEVKRYAASTGSSDVDLISFEDYLVGQFEEKEAQIDVSVYKIQSNKIYSMFSAVLNKHPELYYVNTSLRWIYIKQTRVVTTLMVTYSDYDQDEVEAEITKTLAKLDDGMSDLDKVIAIHDYLCEDIAYPYADLLHDELGDDVHNLKGAVLDKSAVCDGYASAFQYYMHKLGIPCNIVTNQNHAWNQVCLDGKWYMVDVTDDDPVWDYYGNVSHTNLLKSETAFSKGGHTWELDDYERCTDTTYDNAYWTNTNTQMIYHEGAWYYFDNSERRLYKNQNQDVTAQGDYVTALSGYWNVYENSGFRYEKGFVRLASRYGKLIYSMPDCIYMCDFTGANKKALLHADTSDGYIYGMRLQDDEIVYQIAQAPSVENRTEHTEKIADLLNLADATVNLSATDLPYSGERQSPDITVTYGGEPLVQDTDYTLEYAYPASGIGTVTVTITGKGVFYGSNHAVYEIYRTTQTILVESNLTKVYGTEPFLVEASVQGESYQKEDFQYESDHPDVVTVDDKGLVSIVGVGTATITISTEGTEFCFPAQAEMTVKITPAQLPETGKLTDARYVYTGLDIRPEVEIAGLVSGKDYTLAYENNRNAADQNDTAAPTVTVTGVGNYTGTQKLFFTIEQAELGELIDEPKPKTLQYGQTLKESLGETTGTAYFGTAKVSGSFQFAEPDRKPAVTDETEYELFFVPGSSNFKRKSIPIKVKVVPYGEAPGIPETERTVEYEHAALKEVSLSDGWKWSDESRELSLAVGEPTKATAVYTGEDAANYEIISREITVTRLACTHTRTEQRGAYAATCGTDGYTGDVYCLACGEQIGEGDILPATGKHNWDEGQTDISLEGRKIHTCTVCGATIAEQKITLKETDVTVVYGAQTFQITASAQSGTLKYASDHTDVVTVDAQGRVSIVDVGTAHIIVSTEGDTEYLPAQAVVTVQIDPMPLPAQAVLRNTSYVYTGTNIEPEVVLQGLTVGEDYTLAYENNRNAAAQNDKAAPAVILTGIGHYTGTQKLTFTIEKADLGEIAEGPKLRSLNQGQTLAECLVTANGSVWSGQTKISGSFRFAQPAAKPQTSSEYEMIFVPDSANYREKTFRIAVQVISPATTASSSTEAGKTTEKSTQTSTQSKEDTLTASSKKKNTPTTFSIKNKKTYKTTTKVRIKDADGIKRITLNGNALNVKAKAKSVTFKLSQYKKYLKKKGKWNKLVVTDMKGKKKTIKFKTKEL